MEAHKTECTEQTSLSQRTLNSHDVPALTRARTTKKKVPETVVQYEIDARREREREPLSRGDVRGVKQLATRIAQPQQRNVYRI